MLEKHYLVIYPELAIEKKRNKRIHSQLNQHCSDHHHEETFDSHILKKLKHHDINVDNKKNEPTYAYHKHEYMQSGKPMDGLFMHKEADASYYQNQRKYANRSDGYIQKYKQKEENYFQRSMDFFASVCNGVTIDSELTEG